MEVAVLDYKINKIEKKDINDIVKVLIKETNNKNILKEVTTYVRKEVAIKITIQNKMIGFSLIKEFKNHFSLSYYYIYPKYRMKWCSFFFFMHCLHNMKKKPIYVQKNKNYEMYNKYFSTTSKEEIIKFKGLREDKEWAELLTTS